MDGQLLEAGIGRWGAGEDLPLEPPETKAGLPML